jgi:molecular chaperone GrpE
VPGSGDKGKFSTEISDSVIEEALNSVKRRDATAAAPAPVADAAPSDGPEDVTVQVEAPTLPGVAASNDSRDKQIAELEAQLEFSMAKGRELMEKLKDGHEKMVRAVADLENFKKRAAKEKEEMQKFGNERLLKDFLPIIDNLERALEHGKSAADFDSFKQGIAMTRKLFEDTLGKYGVKVFSSVGKMFDPRFHEAMQQQETADVPPNQVVAEILRGFMLNDRLVRPALVMVAKAPAAAAPAAPDQGEGGGAAS